MVPFSLPRSARYRVGPLGPKPDEEIGILHGCFEQYEDAMTNPTSAEDSSFHKDASPSPDAQGQAALLLIESLIHSLIDNGALTQEQAIEALDSAMEVKEDSASEEKEPAKTLRRSLSLLQDMRASIEAKVGRYDLG